MPRPASIHQPFSKVRIDIGARLREERERLGMTQQSLAASFCVQRQAVVLYESGERMPVADQLAVLDQLGGDVGYVITGRRQADLSESARKGLVAAMAAVEDICQTMSSELNASEKLKLALELLESASRSSARSK